MSAPWPPPDRDFRMHTFSVFPDRTVRRMYDSIFKEPISPRWEGLRNLLLLSCVGATAPLCACTTVVQTPYRSATSKAPMSVD